MSAPPAHRYNHAMGRVDERVMGLIACLALFCHGLSADSYRCGRKLIRSGDSSADVIRVCGEPAYKNRGRESIELNGTRKQVAVERWFYRRGSRSLRHIIILHRGKVVAIEAAGR